jgi:hypothetical protein
MPRVSDTSCVGYRGPFSLVTQRKRHSGLSPDNEYNLTLYEMREYVTKQAMYYKWQNEFLGQAERDFLAHYLREHSQKLRETLLKGGSPVKIMETMRLIDKEALDLVELMRGR